MIAELDIYGVFIPSLLAWALIALLITALIKRALEWCGAYRLIWRQPLFDLALFLIVTGGVTALAEGIPL